MKSVAAIAFLSLQFAGSAFAALKTSHTEAEEVVQLRKRALQEKSPLNNEEKDMLKRMLSDNTLRFVDEAAPEEANPLSDAMRRSARAKLGEEGRNLQIHVPGADVPEKVAMVMEAFQDSSGLEEPKLLFPGASYLDAGTEYFFNNEPLLNVHYDTPPGASRAVYLVNSRYRIAVTSGSCTRTDPKSNYVGRAYCQLEYRFLDSTNNVEATIMAEGPITKGDVNTLSITGGTGIFRRTVGTVVLETGALRHGSPPIFIPSDRLDLPSSYLVKMFVFLDSVDLELM